MTTSTQKAIADTIEQQLPADLGGEEQPHSSVPAIRSAGALVPNGPMARDLTGAPPSLLEIGRGFLKTFATATALTVTAMLTESWGAQKSSAEIPEAPDIPDLSGETDVSDPDLMYSYPTDALPQPFAPQGQIYSCLTMEQTRKGIPEIRITDKKEEDISYVGENSYLVDANLWQESPTRIIYHDGKFHTIIMHIGRKPGDRESAENIYITSDDGLKWTVEGIVPNGEPGSWDDKWREGAQIVKFDGKFWMFYSGRSTNPESRNKYGGGVGLLVADSPKGPWKRAVEEPLILPSEDPSAWDHDYVNNPYPVYFNGKWFIYYKSSNEKMFGGSTNGGVAIADSITGPYSKHENNPLFDAHGSWAWVYRGGIAVLPFRSGKIHWSPDGVRFTNVYTPEKPGGYKAPLFSAFYLPHDPLSGDPVTDVEPDEFWGLETRQYGPVPVAERNWSLIRGTVTFNPVSKAKNTADSKLAGEEGEVFTP